MADLQQELINYIRTQLSNGYPLEKIRERLIKSGYEPQVVDSLIESLAPSKPEKKPVPTKRILLEVGFVAILIVAVFLILQWPGTSNVKLLESAIEKGDIITCNKITNTPTRDYCYYYIADANLDASACNKIIERSPSDLAWDYKYPCYTSLAKKTGNSSVCDNIEYSYVSNTCKAIVENDTSRCSKVANKDLRNDCYWLVAKETKTHIYCDRISESSEGAFKQDSCYIDVAQLSKSRDVCDYMLTQGYEDSDYWVGSCYKVVAEELGEVDICNEIGNEYQKKWCTGVVSNDESDCADITNNNWKRSCYASVAVSKLDANMCQEDSSCIKEIAVAKKNQSICNRIESVESTISKRDKQECLAIITEDDSYCNELSDTRYRDGCYEHVGRELGSAEICYKSSDNSYTSAGKLKCFFGDEWYEKYKNIVWI